MPVRFTAMLDDVDAQNKLARLDVAAGDLSPLMDNIGALLEQSSRDRIGSTGISPEGVPWPPSLRVEIEGGKTLFDTGALAGSLSHRAGRREVQVGSNVIYAGIHQTGGTIVPKTADALRFALPGGGFAVVGRVTIPPRPYLGISDTDGEEIEQLAVDHLAAAIGGAS